MRRPARLLLAGLAALVLAGCGPVKPVAAPVDGRTVPVGDGPVGIAAGRGGAVWVANANTVSRIPADAGKPDLAVHVPVPLRVTVAYGAVWVTAFDDGTLVRLDPATGRTTDRVAIGKGTEGVVAAFGAIWVVAQDDGLLVRVDPATRTVSRRIHVGVGVRLVKAGPDALWVNDFRTNRLLRVDPATGRVRRSAVLCSGPQDMVATRHQVWVTCSTSNEVVLVKSNDLTVRTRTHLVGTPDPIRRGPGGTLLVVLQNGPTVATLDPTSLRTLASTKLGTQQQLFDRANLDLVVTRGKVWVTSFLEGRVYRVPAPRTG